MGKKTHHFPWSLNKTFQILESRRSRNPFIANALRAHSGKDGSVVRLRQQQECRERKVEMVSLLLLVISWPTPRPYTDKKPDVQGSKDHPGCIQAWRRQSQTEDNLYLQGGNPELHGESISHWLTLTSNNTRVISRRRSQHARNAFSWEKFYFVVFHYLLYL